MTGNNFDFSLKNGLGVTYRHDADVRQEKTISRVYGSSTLSSDNTKRISEYGAAFIVGVSYSSTKEMDNTLSVVNESQQVNVGALGILGVQINWGPDGLRDIRFGLDGGIGGSIFGGGKLNIQIGGTYVFGK